MASPPDKPARKTTTKSKASPKKTTKAAAPPPKQAPAHGAIAERAYELYLSQEGGDPAAHWLQAERELSAS